MSLMLDREHETEYTGDKDSFGRTALRVVLLSLVVTGLVAGLYLAFGGGDKADPLATGTATQQPAKNAAAKPVAAKPKPLTYAQKVDKAIAELPKGTLSTSAKRAALINYLGKVGIKVTADSSPATAASQGCDLLKAGKSSTELVNGVASGGGYSKDQAKAFLRGASSLYCSSYAKNFK